MTEAALTRVRIVLVEPAGPLNVGAIARVMKNMGLHHLVLVNPQCDPLGAEARQMAVHAADVLEAASVVADLPQALRGCQRTIATTGQIETQAGELLTPRGGLPWLLQAAGPVGLIFGREARGLTGEELQYAQGYIRIPTSPTYSSLNLAQAVGLCCYELHELSRAPLSDGPIPVLPHGPLAAHELLEGYFQQLETLLLRVGYLYPHTASSRMKKLRHLFNRANLSPAEVAMLRGILHQTEWALEHLPRGGADLSPPVLEDFSDKLSDFPG